MGKLGGDYPSPKRVTVRVVLKRHISQTHRSKVGQTTFVNEQVDVVLMLKQVEFMYGLMFRCFLEQLSAFVCCMFAPGNFLAPVKCSPSSERMVPCQIARSGPSFCRAWGKSFQPRFPSPRCHGTSLGPKKCGRGWIVVPNRNQHTSLRQSPKWPVKVEAASSCRRLASSLGSKCS